MALRKRIAALTCLATTCSLLTLVPSTPAAAASTPTLVWSKTTDGIVRESSPLVANVDGQNSVLVGSRDGNLYAMHGSDGNPAAGWPKQLGDPIDSSPAVADVDHNGSNEVFIGSGYGGARSGNMFALRNDGSVGWTFHPSDNDFANLAIFSSSAIGDVNGDGVADVSAFALGLKGWSFATNGALNKGWPYYQDDTVFSSPALYDVDGDGKQDYIVGGDSSPGLPIDHRGGFMRALRGDGSLIWAFPMDEMGRSSPVVGDVDGDGQPEIVFGTGDYWVRQPGGAIDSTKIFVLNMQGQLEWSRDLGGYTPASPALADIDGNGSLDIVESTWGGDNDGKVFAFDGHGTVLPNWNGHLSGGGGVIGQVVTADLDNDNAQDIIVTTGGGVYAWSGDDGSALWGLRQGASAYQNSAWVGDMDGDSRLDIVIAGALPGDTHGIIERYEMPDTVARLGSNHWSQFRYDNRHTGSKYSSALSQDFCAAAPGDGYSMVARDGGVFGYCNSNFFGSMGGQVINAPIVAMARKPALDGYWEFGADGGIYAFGSAQFLGSMGGQPLAKPIVGAAATPSGNGYWMVASDGGIFAFGDAPYKGSMGGQPLSKPIVGMATTLTGNGYWLVASDGGIFAFGDAGFYGSQGGHPLSQPVVGMTSTTSGNGYWLVASDGGIFAFGNAGFQGSQGGQHLNEPIVGIMRQRSGDGYRMVAADGGIFSYAPPFLGSTGSIALNQPIVGLSS